MRDDIVQPSVGPPLDNPWAGALLGGGAIGAIVGGLAYYVGEFITKKRSGMSPLEKTFRQLVVQLIGHVEEQETKLAELRKELSTNVAQSEYDLLSKDLDVVRANNKSLHEANASLARSNGNFQKRAETAEANEAILRERVVDLQARIDRSKRNPNRKRR